MRPLRIGLYPPEQPQWGVNDLNAIGASLATVGERIDLILIWLDLEDFDPAQFRRSLDVIWNRGCVPVINLSMDQPMARVAYPQDAADWGLANRYYTLAATIRAWAAQGGRWLGLLPFPEMNGSWTPYYDANPQVYKDAMGRLRYVLAQTGVAPAVALAYAPNAASFESLQAYYPGSVAALALSSYEFWPGQGPPEGPEVTVNRLRDLRRVAPGLPVVLAQTATARTGHDKVVWARGLAQALALEPDVWGFCWFNVDKEAQWAMTPSQWAEAMAGLNSVQSVRP